MSIRETVEAAQAGLEHRSVLQELELAAPNFQLALPPGFAGGADRFLRIARTAVQNNPDLRACTPRSVIAAFVMAAQLGLTPNLNGQCWVIPYKDNKRGVVEAAFQMGYKGWIELGGRAGIQFWGDTIREADWYQEVRGLVPTLEHIPPHPSEQRERGKALAWYAVAAHRDWYAPAFRRLDRDEVEKFRRASKSPNSPAWTTWYDEMAISKAIRVLVRYLRTSVELGDAIGAAFRADEQVLDLEQVMDLGVPEPPPDVIEATIADRRDPDDQETEHDG